MPFIRSHQGCTCKYNIASRACRHVPSILDHALGGSSAARANVLPGFDRARLMRPIGMRGAGRGKGALRSRQGEAAPNCRIAEYSALNCRFDACSDQRSARWSSA